MKKILRNSMYCFVLMALIFSFAGCGSDKGIKEARTIVDDVFTALKEWDIDNLKEHLLETDEFDIDDFDEIDEAFGGRFNDIIKSMTESLEYKIKSIKKVAPNTIDVVVDISNINMKEVKEYTKNEIKEMVKEVLDGVLTAYEDFGEGRITKEEFTQKAESMQEMENKIIDLVVDTINKGINDCGNKADEITVKLVKVGEEWKADFEEEAVDTILEGINEFETFEEDMQDVSAELIEEFSEKATELQQKYQ